MTCQVLDACLKSLVALLSSRWARKQMMGERAVAKEVLNVLHR